MYPFFLPPPIYAIFLHTHPSLATLFMRISSRCVNHPSIKIIHTLYKDNYVTITNLQLTKNHNPQTAIYLWGVSHSRLLSTVLGNIIRVMHNLRLRRQHEVGVGREWIERAKEAGESDENDSELDKIKYEKFCRGLERLDDALLRLDETLMILRDFL